MSGYAVVDVAIGLSFVFLVISTSATAPIVEAIAGILKKRASSLESWLAGNLVGDDGTSETGNAVAKRVLNHPLIHGMTKGKSQPSYIPAEHFIVALLEGGKRDAATGEKYARMAIAGAADAKKETETLIDGLPEGPIKEVVLRLWNEAGHDVARFRRGGEAWFNQAMDRLSGAYKRWSQLILWGIGLVFAIALNVDAVRIAESLWHDQTLRQLVVEQAQHATSSNAKVNVHTAADPLNNLPLPLGWGGPAGGLPNGFWDVLLKVLGILITSAAVSLGAPFWFDSLSKLANLRNSGPKPSTATGQTSSNAGASGT